MAEPDADADVIAAGPGPRRPLPRPGILVVLLVLAQTVALAVAVVFALHFHAQARAVARVGPSALSQASQTTSLALPDVTTVVLALPADGTVKGTVVITTAALPGAGRGQFTVSAVISGGMPGTFYDLIGSDCSTADPIPDDVWATGLASANGTAYLVGYAWTGAVADRYWLVLDPTLRPACAAGSPKARPQPSRPPRPPAPVSMPV